MTEEIAYSPMGPMYINETDAHEEIAGGTYVNETVVTAVAAARPQVCVCT